MQDLLNAIECTFPGNWSATLFMNDLKTYPCDVDRIQKTLNLDVDLTYLEFFEITRGKERPDSNPIVFELFEKGSIMLYFEEIFLRLINKEHVPSNLLKYISFLSNTPISRWNKTLEGIGASSYQYFSQSPLTYATLLERTKDTDLSDLTDHEILDEYPDVESVSTSREDIIKEASLMMYKR